MSTIDFDAAMSELFGEPIHVTMFGQTWTFANEIPASAILKLKAAASGEGDTDLDDIQLLRAMMTPPTQVDELLAAGISLTGLEMLIRVVIGLQKGIPAETTFTEIRSERAAMADGGPEANPKG